MITIATVQQFAQAACGYWARGGTNPGVYKLLKNALWTGLPGDPVAHDLIKVVSNRAREVAEATRFYYTHRDSAAAEEAHLVAIDRLGEVTRQLCEHVTTAKHR